MTESAAAALREAHQKEGFDPAASRGLFVGVSDFEEDRFSPVLFAVDDAIDLAFLFTKQLGLARPEHVVLALSGSPRKEETSRRLASLLAEGAQQVSAKHRDFCLSLEKLTRASQPAGLFVLSVATHGLSENGDDFLVASDSFYQRKFRSVVSVSELFGETARAGSLRRFVLLDACRERVDQETREVNSDGMAETFAAAIGRTTGQVVLSGATLGGFAYDDRRRRNGVFTSAVLDGLQGAAPADERGWITARTLADYVQARVASWVRENRPDHVIKSQGIARRIEGPAESLPLAVDPRRAEAYEKYRSRRRAALAILKGNIAEESRGESIAILRGAFLDEVLLYLPKEGPGDHSIRVLEEIEALDGSPRSQRNLKQFVRDLRGDRTVVTMANSLLAVDDSGSKQREPSAAGSTRSQRWIQGLQKLRQNPDWIILAILALVALVAVAVTVSKFVK